ncbi:MAG: LytTR family DNA-binding domain-containing protein [Bacteroidota bacterium]
MSIRTLVIDDESAFIGNLESILQSRDSSLELVGDARSVEEGLQKIDELEPELVFLDIQMEDGTGFDLLDRCERKDFKVIFVTAYDQYAIEAFRFSAVDYLLKPVVSTDLWSSVDRAVANIEKSRVELQINVLMENIHSLSKEKKKLVLREADVLHVVRLEEILWCAADGSYTAFHLEGGTKIIVSQHLKEFEEILDKNGFFRAHRSYLVNVNKIRKFDKREGGIIYLDGGSALPVSVRKKEKLLQILSHLL